MFDRKIAYLETLPLFAAYLGASLALTLLFALAYSAITPIREWRLIAAGNTAAAVSMSGAILGFALALSGVLAHAVSLTDLAVWGVVSLVVQLAVTGAMRALKPSLFKGIDEGRLAHGILLGAACLAAGVLQAAAMTP
jgi:putative membrane protein